MATQVGMQWDLLYAHNLILMAERRDCLIKTVKWKLTTETKGFHWQTKNESDGWLHQNIQQIEFGPVPNVMAALAEYRWRPLFNAAKFGWRPILECRALTLPRRETRWNLQGYPKLANRSQPLVGRSSPYYEDIWRRYCCLTSFFPIVDTCLSCEDIARQICGMVTRSWWRLFGDFSHAVFSASCAQHVSDLHSKFTLRPHHVWKYGRHPICGRWD